MALKRIEPLTSRYNLGYLLLWQDQLSEVTRLMSQLTEATPLAKLIKKPSLYMEADGFTLTNVTTDLPCIEAKRIKEFKASVTRPGKNGNGDSILRIELSTTAAYIDVTNADLETLGAANTISSLMKKYERAPRGPLSEILRSGVEYELWQRTLAAGFFAFAAYFCLWVFTQILMYGFVGKSPDTIPQTVLYLYAALGLVIATTWLIASSQVRVTLYTRTRAEAPTWWQEHRSDVGINAAFSAVFLILGAVIGHYWH
jgi:hypothetical protein